MDDTHCRAETADEKSEGNDAEPGVDVGMTMEELTHRVDVRVVPRVRAIAALGGANGWRFKGLSLLQ
jgi:hypothetical protein